MRNSISRTFYRLLGIDIYIQITFSAWCFNCHYSATKSISLLDSLHIIFLGFLYSVANVATKTAVKVKDSVKETVEGKVQLY